MNLQVESTFQVPIRINNGKAIPRTIIIKLNMKNTKKNVYSYKREGRLSTKKLQLELHRNFSSATIDRRQWHIFNLRKISNSQPQISYPDKL